MSVCRTAARRRREARLDKRYKVRSKEHQAKRNAHVLEKAKLMALHKGKR